MALVAWIAGAVLLVLLHVSPRDALLLSLAVTVQALAGAFFWQRLRGRGGRSVDLLELIGMGIALGSIVALLAGVILLPVIPDGWGWLASPIIAVVWMLARRVKGAGSDGVAPIRVSAVLPAIAGLALGLGGLLLSLTRYPLVWSGEWSGYHRDMVFFEALGTSVSRFGSWDSIFMSGAEIRYHWFAYGWVGQLTNTTGAAPFAALTRVLPIVALIAVVALAVTWARSLSTTRWVPWLAVVLIVIGGYAGAVNGTILNFDSPSQAFTTVWLMAFVFALMRYLRDGASRIEIVPIGLLMIASVGGKISTGVIALGATAVVAFIAVVRREPWRFRALLALALSAIAFVATYVIVLMGNASSGDLKVLKLANRASTLQGLDSSVLDRGIILGTMALAIAVSYRWLGGIWLLIDRSWRWRPETWLGVGLVIFSLMPLVVFSQGVNELWFALAASAPLAVLSCVGLAIAWERAAAPRWIAWVSVMTGALVLLVVSLIWTDRFWDSGLIRFWGPWVGIALSLLAGIVLCLFARARRFTVMLAVATTALVVCAAGARGTPIFGDLVGGSRDGAGISMANYSDAPAMPVVEEFASTATSVEAVNPSVLIPEPRDKATLSQDERDAADFLRQNAASSDILVTNETLTFTVPAFTGMRSFIAGSPYQLLYGGKASVGEIPERIAAALAFTTAPDDATFATVCTAGVTWAWIARDLVPNASFDGYGSVAYENDGVTIIALDRSKCPA